MRRIPLAVLLLVVLASAPAASSRPQIPASNGWIAFVSFREDAGPVGFGIYRLEPLGGRVSRVGELRGRQLAWSPDGSLLAFVDLRWRLVVARSNGQVVKVLTSGKYFAQDPSWSPDGSRIVFNQSGRWRFRGDLVVAAADGSSMRRITRTRHDDVDPSWSPTGSLIAFSSDRPVQLSDDHEIAVVRPDGTRLRNLTANEFRDRAPAWSPDGSRIAFVSGRDPGRFSDELWTMRSDGRDQRLVQRTSDPSGIPSWSEWSPGWSPDGNWIVYVTNETFYPDNIFIVRPDGQDKTDLTPQTPSQDFDPAWQPLCSHMGTSGRDVLRGTLADDRLCGFFGPDLLTGGAGRDGLYGADGNDVIRARDGSFDVVGCGAGRDEVVADRVDLVGVDCERIRRR